jgi:hypothetical protein
MLRLYRNNAAPEQVNFRVCCPAWTGCKNFTYSPSEYPSPGIHLYELRHCCWLCLGVFSTCNLYHEQTTCVVFKCFSRQPSNGFTLFSPPSVGIISTCLGLPAISPPRCLVTYETTCTLQLFNIPEFLLKNCISRSFLIKAHQKPRTIDYQLI